MDINLKITNDVNKNQIRSNEETKEPKTSQINLNENLFNQNKKTFKLKPLKTKGNYSPIKAGEILKTSKNKIKKLANKLFL